jgi:hypothetical protein
MSESPDSGEWHEDPRVAVTRLVCQVLVTLAVLGFSVFLVLTHPEYNAGVALVCGVVLGSWFTMPANLGWGRHRRKDRDED